MRKKQVCPCLNICTAPTCSCVFVCVVLSKKKLFAAAVTAVGVTTPSKSSLLRYRRRPWGGRSQWAARSCKGSGLLASPFGLVLGDHRHVCLDAKAPVTREGPGSVARYYYRRVRLLGRTLAFRFGLLGWRCARSAQLGVLLSRGGSFGPTGPGGGGASGQTWRLLQTFPWLGQGRGGLSRGGGGLWVGRRGTLSRRRGYSWGGGGMPASPSLSDRSGHFGYAWFVGWLAVSPLFGWREAEHARDMQLHYEESSVRKRFR